MATFDYREATSKLLRYWEKYHEDYITLVPEYEVLIQHKKELKLQLNNSKDNIMLKGYPHIPFLMLTRKSAVLNMIDDMKPAQMKRLLKQIEEEIVSECSCFNLMKRSVKFHKDDIKHQTSPKCYAPALKGIRSAKQS